MGLFVDSLLLRFTDATQMTELLSPASDPGRERLRKLVEAVYDMPFATIHAIPEFNVQKIRPEQPLFPKERKKGTWIQTNPGYIHTDVKYENDGGIDPVWLDLVVDTNVSLLLELDKGEIESILTNEITGYTTLNDFRSRFRFIDLDAFMEKHKITTVEELRESFQYLLTEIRGRIPDQLNDTSAYSYPLNVLILIRDTENIANVLREVKYAKRVAEHVLSYDSHEKEVEIITPYAPIVIFPDTVFTTTTFDKAAVINFFAREQIVVVFVALT